MDHDHQSHEGQNSNRIFNWILIGFLLVAGYFLVMEHRAHLGGVLYYLPFLLLLACPLMHLFMHHGHGSHGEHPSQKDDRGEQK
jgi:Protein of unknown function (DUF2933)